MASRRSMCIICDRRMDDDDRQPVTLPGCGHTCCKQCVKAKGGNCPICRRNDNVAKWLGVGISAVIGGFALVAAAPVALAAVGFTSGGIAGGSIAAGMMSSAAIANGGGVAAGSLVAVLQSAGAAGIGTAASAALGATGAAVGGAVGNAILKPSEDKEEDSIRNKTKQG